MQQYILQTTSVDFNANDAQKKLNLLLLGDWCKKNVMSSDGDTVVDYHWDDRDKLGDDLKAVNKLYNDYLVNLAAVLNEVHKVDKDIEFWRIVVGPWLLGFIRS